MRVSLLPPHYVRAYVRRNKTDSADAMALLEAARASDIVPVRVKSVEQQGLQSLHRLRSCWRATCTARINTLRGLCKEFGIIAPLHSRGVAELRRRLISLGAEAPLNTSDPRIWHCGSEVLGPLDKRMQAGATLRERFLCHDSSFQMDQIKGVEDDFRPLS